MVTTGKKPATILWVHKESLTGTDVVVARDGKDLGGAVTRGGLGWPDAHLPAVVEHEAVGAAVLKDGVVVLVLVELYAAVEAGAVLGVAVVALPRALQHSLRVLPGLIAGS